MSLLNITLPLSAEQTRNSVCWLTWEDSPDPREPFTSLHRTRFLPSWWGEMVSARSLSPRDDARQVKPPASSEPGLSGIFLRENYASSPTRTQAQLWTLPQQSCQSWDQRTPLSGRLQWLQPLGGDPSPQLGVSSSPGREFIAFSPCLFCWEPKPPISSKGKPSHA